jgi:hypothetical protein
LLHDFGHGVPEAFVISLLVDRFAAFPRARELEKPGRADQAANVRG